MPASGPTRSGASPGGSTPGPGTSSTCRTGAPWRARRAGTRTTCWRRWPASRQELGDESLTNQPARASRCGLSCTSSWTSTSRCTWAGRRIAAGTSCRCWWAGARRICTPSGTVSPCGCPAARVPGTGRGRCPGRPPTETRRWQAASPLDWARESQALRPQVYGFRPGHGPRRPCRRPTWRGTRATVDRRLVQAGVRLAGRLNAVLGPGGPCPGRGCQPSVKPLEFVGFSRGCVQPPLALRNNRCTQYSRLVASSTVPARAKK